MKKNLSLYIGLSIPVLMTLFVAASIYIPRYFVNPPTYRFLYTGGNNYNVKEYFTIKNNTLMKEENPNCPPNSNPGNNFKTEPRLFLYDPAKDAAEEITFDKGLTYILDSRVESPDGYTASGYIREAGLSYMFGGRDRHSRYLKKGSFVKKINTQVDTATAYGFYDFRFLAWVTGEKNEQTGMATTTQ